MGFALLATLYLRKALSSELWALIQSCKDSAKPSMSISYSGARRRSVGRREGGRRVEMEGGRRRVKGWEGRGKLTGSFLWVSVLAPCATWLSLSSQYPAHEYFLWRCEGVKVWGCEGVRVWRCGVWVRVWRCGVRVCSAYTCKWVAFTQWSRGMQKMTGIHNNVLMHSQWHTRSVNSFATCTTK